MIPKTWKILKIQADDIPWDFLIDGGVHSVFSTISDKKILFTDELTEYTSNLKKNKIFSIVKKNQNILKDCFELCINNYILKVEKKSTRNILEIIDRIQFDIYSNNTQLSEYMNLPRIPLLFIREDQFQLGWLEPNFSMFEIYKFPTITCKEHVGVYRQCMNIEFKPKCALPFIVNDYTLYRVLQKIIIENPLILENACISKECFKEEFNLIFKYSELKKKNIPCQISIQKLLKNYSIEDNYNPTNLYFFDSYRSLFFEFLKVLKISGRIIKKGSIFNYDDFTKNNKNNELIKNEIPLFIESIICYSDIFKILASYHTYCSGQQLLAFYLFNTLKIILSSRDIKKLINNHMSKMSADIEKLIEQEDTEFYNKKMYENFQLGLLILTRLIFNIRYISRNYNVNDLKKKDKNKFKLDKETYVTIKEAIYWLFKFFFGRSVCDCSLVISILYTNSNCFCPKLYDFKLLTRKNEQNIWTKLRIIDISNKPIEKITIWKNQFVNLLKKLISHETQIKHGL